MTNQLLTDLLKKPTTPSYIKEAWQSFVGSDTLYRALTEAVRENKIGARSLKLINDWETFARNNDSSAAWKKAVCLIWSAVQAAKPDEADAKNLRDAPQMSGAKVGWEKPFINVFRDYSLRQVTVPIARDDDDGKGIFNLQLTLLSAGSGRLVRHPADIFVRNADAKFEAAMENAWQAARRLKSETGADVSIYDGCWRVLDANNQAVEKLNGASAGGAAAVGWTRLFESQKADERIIVMASADADGNLSAVGKVEEKTAAVTANEEIDTIVVGDADNKNKIEQVLRENKKTERISVKLAATLVEAAEIESQLATELTDYCQRLIEELDPTPWDKPTGGKAKISEIAVPVRVKKSPSSISADSDIIPSGIESADKIKFENERAPRAEIDEDGDEPFKSEFSNSAALPHNPVAESIDPYQLEHYEESYSDDSDEISWTKAFSDANDKLILLRAGPGFGKTVHTKHEVIKAAQMFSYRLKNRLVAAAEATDLPAWLPLVKLAETNYPDVAESILQTINTQLNLNSTVFFPAYLKSKLPQSSILFFDGFDELEGRQIEATRDKFRAMREWTSRRCVTCRYGNYKVDVLSPDPIPEYWLASFRGDWLSENKAKKHEIEKFVRKWFGDDELKAERLLGIVRRNFALHHQCRSPLLLTFTCLQASKISETTTCADLFESVVDYLLRESWRSQEADMQEIGRYAFGVSDEDSQAACAWALLPETSFNLINGQTTGNRFTTEEIADAMDAARRKPQQPFPAIEWLKKKGLLAAAGNEMSKTNYSFAHRALFEFLAAKHLKTLPGYFDIVRSHITDLDEPEKALAWCFILPPLVGMLDDPTRIIELLIDLINDDRYESHRETYVLTLLTCLLECKQPLNEDLREKAFEVLVIGIDSAQFALKKKREWQILGNRYRLARILAAAKKHYGDKPETDEILKLTETLAKHYGTVSSEIKQELVPQLNRLKNISNITPPERWSLIWASVVLEKGAAKNFFTAALQDPNCAIRALAIRALVEIRSGKDPIFDLLTNRLQHESANYTKGRIISALGIVKNKRAVEYVKGYLSADNKSPKILRVPAMFTLAEFADDDSAEIFRGGLNDEEAESIQTSAITGLARLRNESDYKKFIDKLKNASSPKVRRSAAWACGKLKIKEAVGSLVEGFTGDANAEVRMTCYDSVSRYALAEAEPSIRDFLKKASASQKSQLAYSWKLVADRWKLNRQEKKNEAGEPRNANYRIAAGLCLNLLKDDDAKVRETACWALMSLMRINNLRNNNQLKNKVTESVVSLLFDSSPAVQKFGFHFLIQLVRLSFGKDKQKDLPIVRRAVKQTLKILSDLSVKPENKIAGYAFLVELVRKRMRVSLNDKSLARVVVEESLRLLPDASAGLKINALQAFKELLPLEDLKDNSILRQRTAEICLSLLSDAAVDVRIEASEILSGIISTTKINSIFADRLRTAATDFLNDSVPEINAAGFWMLSEILKNADANRNLATALIFLRDETWLEKLFGQIRRALSDDLLLNDSPAVTAYALRVLRFLLLKPSKLRIDSEAIVWLAEKCAAFLNDYLPLDLKAQVLPVLDAILLREGIKDSARLQKDIASACLETLRDIEINAPEENKNRYFSQKTGAILLEKIFVESLKDEKELIHEALTVCLSLTESRNVTVAAAALQTCDKILTKTDIRHDSIIKTAVDKALKQINNPSPTVRSSVIGVFIACAFVIRKDSSLTSTLFDKSLNCLNDLDPNVKKSAVILLENLIIESHLGSDERLCRSLVDRCMALVRRERDDKVCAAALRTIETALIQPALFGEQQPAKSVAERILVLLANAPPALREAACGVLGCMAQNKMPVLLDDDLLLKIVNECLFSLNGRDRRLKRIVIFLLRHLISFRPDFFRDRMPLFKSILRQTLTISAASNGGDAELTERARGLLSLITAKRVELFNRQSPEDAELRKMMWRRGRDILESDRSSDRIKENVLILLQTFSSDLPYNNDDGGENEVVAEVAEICSEILREDDFKQAGSNACDLLDVLIRKRLPVVVSDSELCRSIARQSLNLLSRENAKAKVKGFNLLLQMTRKRISAFSDDDLLTEAAGKCLEELNGQDSTAETHAAKLLYDLLKENESFFRNRTTLLHDVFRRSVEILKNYQVASLGAEASRLFKVSFRRLEAALAADYRDEIVKDVARIGLQMMHSDELCEKGCKLINTFVQSELSVVVDDDAFCRQAARRGVVLLDSSSAQTRNSADFLLSKMREKQVSGFLKDELSVKTFAEKSNEARRQVVEAVRDSGSGEETAVAV